MERRNDSETSRRGRDRIASRAIRRVSVSRLRGSIVYLHWCSCEPETETLVLLKLTSLVPKYTVGFRPHRCGERSSSAIKSRYPDDIIGKQVWSPLPLRTRLPQCVIKTKAEQFKPLRILERVCRTVLQNLARNGLLMVTLWRPAMLVQGRPSRVSRRHPILSPRSSLHPRR